MLALHVLFRLPLLFQSGLHVLLTVALSWAVDQYVHVRRLHASLSQRNAITVAICTVHWWEACWV